MMFHHGPSIWAPLVYLLYGSILVPAYFIIVVLGIIHVIALLTKRDPDIDHHDAPGGA